MSKAIPGLNPKVAFPHCVLLLLVGTGLTRPPPCTEKGFAIALKSNKVFPLFFVVADGTIREKSW